MRTFKINNLEFLIFNDYDIEITDVRKEVNIDISKEEFDHLISIIAELQMNENWEGLKDE